jgi:hypothetical protein
MAKSSHSRTGDRAHGLSGTQTVSGGLPPGRRRPEFVHPGCTNIGLPLGSERGLSDDKDRQHFVCATWLHKAREMPKEQFKEVEKELTLWETEACEIIYFKLYKSQIPAIDQAIETAALMTGPQLAGAYGNCADSKFLNNSSHTALASVRTIFLLWSAVELRSGLRFC